MQIVRLIIDGDQGSWLIKLHPSDDWELGFQPIGGLYDACAFGRFEAGVCQITSNRMLPGVPLEAMQKITAVMATLKR